MLLVVEDEEENEAESGIVSRASTDTYQDEQLRETCDELQNVR